MNVVELRSQIQGYVEQLSNNKLLIAADFLAHLAQEDGEDQTEKLINISGFQDSFVRAKKNINEDKVIAVEQSSESISYLGFISIDAQSLSLF
jgi:hypothetical protein